MSGIHARLRLARPDFLLDVDLRLPGHGVTALFGPSGCGTGGPPTSARWATYSRKPACSPT
jgi:hypothetical protein